MKATINGITLEGTPQEIMEYQKIMDDMKRNSAHSKPPLGKPLWITMGEPTMYPPKKCDYPCNCTGACYGSNLHKMTESFNALSNYSKIWGEKAP